MKVSFWVPKVPSVALANLIGLLGLAGVAYFVGSLLGDWRWSGLIGSVVLVAMGALNARSQEAPAAEVEEAEADGALTAPTAQLTVVKPKTAKTA